MDGCEKSHNHIDQECNVYDIIEHLPRDPGFIDKTDLEGQRHRNKDEPKDDPHVPIHLVLVRRQNNALMSSFCFVLFFR